MMIKSPPMGFTEDNFCAVVRASDPQAKDIKTETRRLLKLKGLSQKLTNELQSFYQDGDGNWIGWANDSPHHSGMTKELYPKGSNKGIKSKYQVGDRHYLTEPTQIVKAHEFLFHCDVKYFWYDDEIIRRFLTPKDKISLDMRKTGYYSKQIARFMLKSFARYSVEITDVRIERLLDITEEAAIAEGVKYHVNRGYLNGNLNYEYPLYWDYMTNQYSFKSPITSYLSEIAAIHKPTKDKIGGYDLVDSNPWVWVYKFKLAGETQ